MAFRHTLRILYVNPVTVRITCEGTKIAEQNDSKPSHLAKSPEFHVAIENYGIVLLANGMFQQHVPKVKIASWCLYYIKAIVAQKA